MAGTRAGRHLRRGAAMAGALVLFPAGVAAAAQQDAGAVIRIPLLAGECEGARGGDEIVVCGQRNRERSPFRLPEEPDRGFDPDAGVDSVSRERNRLMEPGASGTGSCSPVGPGGWTGCQAIPFRNDIDQHGGNLPRARNGYRRRR